LGRGLRTLPLHEPGHVLVKLELVAFDPEVGRLRNPLGEDLLRRPRPVLLSLREVDHRLLRPPQVERCPPLFHRLADRLHVSVGVRVEQLQEERKVLRLPLVRRGGEKQQVVRRVAEQFPEGVAGGLAGRGTPRHAVCFVHDDQIPVDLLQARQDVLPLGQIERRDDVVPLHPLVDAELLAYHVPAGHLELLVELLLEFPLPLECQVRRADDKDSLGESAELQFADEQPGHDRLPGPGVVGEEEPHAGDFEQVLVDRFELVRQRIDAGDRKAEIRVELVGDAERVRLNPEAEPDRVPRETARGFLEPQRREVRKRHVEPTKPLRLDPDQTDRPRPGPVLLNGFDPVRFAEERPRHHPAGSKARIRHRRYTSSALRHRCPVLPVRHFRERYCQFSPRGTMSVERDADRRTP